MWFSGHGGDSLELDFMILLIFPNFNDSMDSDPVHAVYHFLRQLGSFSLQKGYFLLPWHLITKPIWLYWLLTSGSHSFTPGDTTLHTQWCQTLPAPLPVVVGFTSALLLTSLLVHIQLSKAVQICFKKKKIQEKTTQQQQHRTKTSVFAEVFCTS